MAVTSVPLVTTLKSIALKYTNILTVSLKFLIIVYFCVNQGMSFGPDGRLYVASFLGNSVVAFDADTGDFAGTYLHVLPVLFLAVPANSHR